MLRVPDRRLLPLRPPLLLASVVLLLAATPAQAREDFFEPAALGMGGAVRVLGGDISSVRLNAATMVVRPNYLVGASYSYFGREKSHQFSTGAFDSKSSSFSLGSTYSVHIFTPVLDPGADLNWFKESEVIADTRTTHRWEVAAGYGFLDRRLNVGGAARILRHQNRIREDSMRFSLDTGLTFFPLPILGFGVSAQNMIPTKDPRFPTRLSGGLGLMIEGVLDLGVDAVVDFTSQSVPKVDIHGGVTVRLFQYFLLRGGYYGDRGFLDNHVTWGLGLDLGKVRVDFAMRIEVGPIDARLRDDRKEAPQRVWNSIGVGGAF